MGQFEHPRYGTIGTYSNVIKKVGENLEIQTELHVAVKLFGKLRASEENS